MTLSENIVVNTLNQNGYKPYCKLQNYTSLVYSTKINHI